MASVMKEFVLPSNKRRGIGSINLVFKTCFRTKADSITQCVEPESTKDLNIISGTDGVTNSLQETWIKKEWKH
jgi:hypothetical protein